MRFKGNTINNDLLMQLVVNASLISIFWCDILKNTSNKNWLYPLRVSVFKCELLLRLQHKCAKTQNILINCLVIYIKKVILILLYFRLYFNCLFINDCLLLFFKLIFIDY